MNKREIEIEENFENHSHHSHNSHHKHTHKKKHTTRNIIIVLICFILVVCIGGAALVNNVLNKIEFEESLQINPDFEDSVELPDEYNYAEKEAEENFHNKGVYFQENVTNYLICGIDRGDSKMFYPRSDTMMILSVNNNDNTVRLASLSRAVYVKIKDHKSTRLNAAYAYGGPQLLIDTIENNYKIKIDRYISIDFEAFKKIVNIFDGIDIYLTDKEALGVRKSLNSAKVYSSFTYKGAGTYHLDGESALMFARLRYIDSDRERTGRQRKVVKAIFENVKSLTLSQGIEIIDELLPCVTTNLTKTEILSQSTKITKYLSWNIEETVIPDKSSDLINVDNSDVLLVDWEETINYSKSFFYPDF